MLWLLPAFLVFNAALLPLNSAGFENSLENAGGGCLRYVGPVFFPIDDLEDVSLALSNSLLLPISLANELPAVEDLRLNRRGSEVKSAWEGSEEEGEMAVGMTSSSLCTLTPKDVTCREVMEPMVHWF